MLGVSVCAVIAFSGPPTEGLPYATPQDSPPHGGGACCPQLFGYLLPPLSLEKTVTASARMLSLKESAAGGRSSLRGPHCAPVANLYIALVLWMLL